MTAPATVRTRLRTGMTTLASPGKRVPKPGTFLKTGGSQAPIR